MTLLSTKCLADSQAPQDAKIAIIQAALVGPAGGSLAGNYPNPSFSQAGVDSVLSGMALSTDATYGKSRSATSLETGAGVLNDGVHVSPADLLAAARTATTFAAAIAINPNKYGTFASVAAPTLAPTESNPKVILTNSNQEVFAWTGTKWALIANGFRESLVTPRTLSSNQNGVVLIAGTWTAQRAGKVRFEVKMDSIFQSAGVGGRSFAYLYSTIDPLLGSTTDFSYSDAGFLIATVSASVVAGQVVSFGSYGNGSSATNNNTGNNGINPGTAGYSYFIAANMTYET
jgi:hypothetical protein